MNDEEQSEQEEFVPEVEPQIELFSIVDENGNVVSNLRCLACDVEANTPEGHRACSGHLEALKHYVIGDDVLEYTEEQSAGKKARLEPGWVWSNTKMHWVDQRTQEHHDLAAANNLERLKAELAAVEVASLRALREAVLQVVQGSARARLLDLDARASSLRELLRGSK